MGQAQDAGVQKKGKGGLIGATAVLAGASIVGGSYYAMTREPQPRVLPPVKPPVNPLPAASAPGPALPVPSPLAPPAVSARDELLQRVESLKAELQELRKQKRDKLVDMQKKAIKDEIHTIQTGVAALDKKKL